MLAVAIGMGVLLQFVKFLLLYLGACNAGKRNGSVIAIAGKQRRLTIEFSQENDLVS